MGCDCGSWLSGPMGRKPPRTVGQGWPETCVVLLRGRREKVKAVEKLSICVPEKPPKTMEWIKVKAIILNLENIFLLVMFFSPTFF